MNSEKLSFLQKRIKSFSHAFSGLRVFFAETPNVQIHLIATVAVVVLCAWLRVSLMEWAILIVCIFTVLVAEAFNTALENAVDLVTDDWHALAKKAKDVAAAAVLLAALGSVIVGVIILGPKLWALL